MTQNISTLRRKKKKKEKEGRRKRKKKIDQDSYWHITYITDTKFYYMSSLCIYKLFHIHNILSS